MAISRTRACTALPAVALAAALALAPVTAHAAEAPSADVPSIDVPSAEVVPAPVEDVDVDPAPGVEGSGTGDGDVSDEATAPVVAAPVPAAATPAPDAPAAPAVPPVPAPVTSAAVVVVEQEQEDPFVESGSTVLHPGGLDSFSAGGFTAGDAVRVDVTGESVTDVVVFTVTPWWSGPFVFDEDGYAGFDLAVPAEVPLGTTLTVSVADESGREVSVDLVTVAPLPAPSLVVPEGGTAGVVALPGSGAEAGGAVLVTVQAVEDDASGESVVTFGSAVADDEDALPWTTGPQRLDEDFGIAQALVPVAEDGTFLSEFDLPEGDYVAYAFQVDLETGDSSEISDPDSFTLTAAPAAVAPVAVPVAVAPPVATTVVVRSQAPRAARLAQTGQESTGWAALAGGLVLAGAGLLSARRLRRRS